MCSAAHASPSAFRSPKRMIPPAIPSVSKYPIRFPSKGLYRGIYAYIGFRDMIFRVQAFRSKYPLSRYFGFWVVVIIVQVLGKYRIIRHLEF